MTITIQKHSLRLDTKTYTVKDILDEIYEDRDLLVALGYVHMKDYTYRAAINTRKGVKRIGDCRKVAPNIYEIRLTEKYLRGCDPKEIHNTIMHEVIHSVKGCMNHGESWQAVAHRVNKYYEFTPIQRLSNDPIALQLAKESAKYFLFCSNCGREWKWLRKPRRWDYYISGNCKCQKCGRPYEFDIT